MKTAFIMNRNDIQLQLRYNLIYEATERSAFNTGRAKRMLKEMFTEEEIKEIREKVIPKARRFAIRGVPENFTMTTREFNLWKLFERYCSVL